MTFLKKILTIFLLAVYFLAATAGGEFAKLPKLVKHFRDHKMHDNTIGLASFIVMHYRYANDNDNDATEDNKLPFKSVSFFKVRSIAATIPPGSIKVACGTDVFPIVPFKEADNFILSSNYLHNIWNPPKA